MCAHQNAVAVVTTQGGEVEPALPRQAGAAGRQPRAHQTQPVGGAEASVVRPVADCRSANNHRKQKKKESNKRNQSFFLSFSVFAPLKHSLQIRRSFRFKFVWCVDKARKKKLWWQRAREREREREREQINRATRSRNPIRCSLPAVNRMREANPNFSIGSQLD